MEDLQDLLEKINREGVEKADAEAAKITAAAQAKAVIFAASASAFSTPSRLIFSSRSCKSSMS